MRMATESVQQAFDALISNDQVPNADKPSSGNLIYPHQYGKTNANPDDPEVRAALDAIPECHTGQKGYKFFEFPITDPVFAGHNDPRAQGQDRVVAIAQNVGQGGSRTFTYCLAMTHRGAPTEGAFVPCVNA